jgi:hypothetical protein
MSRRDCVGGECSQEYRCIYFQSRLRTKRRILKTETVGITYNNPRPKMNIKLILVRRCSLSVLITGIGKMNMMMSEEIFKPGDRSVSCGPLTSWGRRALNHGTY